ncbi:Uncharacterised protein [Mycobacteroides abscessus subsp. abscessus]|nr:Uncharacterised protein [Mycobacteroides abscessus subsp. abscessus]
MAVIVENDMDGFLFKLIILFFFWDLLFVYKDDSPDIIYIFNLLLFNCFFYDHDLKFLSKTKCFIYCPRTVFQLIEQMEAVDCFLIVDTLHAE